MGFSGCTRYLRHLNAFASKANGGTVKRVKVASNGVAGVLELVNCLGKGEYKLEKL